MRTDFQVEISLARRVSVHCLYTKSSQLSSQLYTTTHREGRGPETWKPEKWKPRNSSWPSKFCIAGEGGTQKPGNQEARKVSNFLGFQQIQIQVENNIIASDRERHMRQTTSLTITNKLTMSKEQNHCATCVHSSLAFHSDRKNVHREPKEMLRVSLAQTHTGATATVALWQEYLLEINLPKSVIIETKVGESS